MKTQRSSAVLLSENRKSIEIQIAKSHGKSSCWPKSNLEVIISVNIPWACDMFSCNAYLGAYNEKIMLNLESSVGIYEQNCVQDITAHKSTASGLSAAIKRLCFLNKLL